MGSTCFKSCFLTHSDYAFGFQVQRNSKDILMNKSASPFEEKHSESLKYVSRSKPVDADKHFMFTKIISNLEFVIKADLFRLFEGNFRRWLPH